MIYAQDSISMGFVNSTVLQAYQAREQDLRTSITALQAKGADVSNLDLIALQQEIAQWTLFTQIQSSLTKEITDAMKGVIQKAA
jgi:type III secretion protein F